MDWIKIQNITVVLVLHEESRSMKSQRGSTLNAGRERDSECRTCDGCIEYTHYHEHWKVPSRRR